MSVKDVLRSNSINIVGLCEVPVRSGWFLGPDMGRRILSVSGSLVSVDRWAGGSDG